jgi:hypothetical protein
VTAGTPVAFLSDDAMLAGTHAVAGIESHIYAAYYGYMTVVPGTGQVTGVSVIPRLYEDPDYVDNRASACLWGLATSAQGVGLLLDEGSVAVLDGTVLTVRGATPAVVVDARVSPWVDFPSWRDPGKTHPRQNAALVDARLHIIRSDGALNLGPATDATLDPSIPPRGFRLDPAYPNPFNGTTQLTAHFERQVHATLTIVDLQGRAVGRLLDRSVDPGFITIRWDARGFPSGVYFAWLQVADQQDVTRIALVR